MAVMTTEGFQVLIDREKGKLTALEKEYEKKYDEINALTEKRIIEVSSTRAERIKLEADIEAAQDKLDAKLVTVEQHAAVVDELNPKLAAVNARAEEEDARYKRLSERRALELQQISEAIVRVKEKIRNFTDSIKVAEELEAKKGPAPASPRVAKGKGKKA